MSPLSLIVAMNSKRVIGKDGKIPWHSREDLANFKSLTLGHVVIMGRKTYESIGKPLPNRTNLVVSNTLPLDTYYTGPNHLEVVLSLEHASIRARDIAANPLGRPCFGEPFILGGARLYAEALPLATRIYLTEVDADVDGDVFFPEFDFTEWEESERVAMKWANPPVRFSVLDRKTGTP